MTVYAVQHQHHMNPRTGLLEPKFDLRPAQIFGELKFLLGPGARPFSSEHVIAELSDKLVSYSATRDHLLLIGNPCLIGFAVAIAARQDPYGHVMVLQWDGKRREYISVSADLGSKVRARTTIRCGACAGSGVRTARGLSCDHCSGSGTIEITGVG